jgi:hypothetical protein
MSNETFQAVDYKLYYFVYRVSVRIIYLSIYSFNIKEKRSVVKWTQETDVSTK